MAWLKKNRSMGFSMLTNAPFLFFEVYAKQVGDLRRKTQKSEKLFFLFSRCKTAKSTPTSNWTAGAGGVHLERDFQVASIFKD